MNSVRLQCSDCGSALKTPLASASVDVQCPLCEKPTVLHVFPALINEEPRGQSGETLLVADESSCFYHPSKKAVVVCDHCGGFLCSLCDIEISGRHLCPSCVASSGGGNALPLANRTLFYDNMALALAIYPIITIWLTLISAPMAIFVALWYWRKQHGVFPRRRWRFLLAIAIALSELAGWAGIVVLIFFGGAS